MKHRSESGFSLIEQLVSIAIMSTALLVAFDLIDHALRVFSESAAAATNPLTIHTEELIRADLMSARVFPFDGQSSSGPLILQLWDGSQIEWKLEGESLVRTEMVEGIHKSQARPLPRQVVGWWWRVVSENLVEVKILINGTPTADGLQLQGPLEKASEVITRVVYVSPRGVRGNGSW